MNCCETDVVNKSCFQFLLLCWRLLQIHEYCLCVCSFVVQRHDWRDSSIFTAAWCGDCRASTGKCSLWMFLGSLTAGLWHLMIILELAKLSLSRSPFRQTKTHNSPWVWHHCQITCLLESPLMSPARSGIKATEWKRGKKLHRCIFRVARASNKPHASQQPPKDTVTWPWRQPGLAPYGLV